MTQNDKNSHYGGLKNPGKNKQRLMWTFANIETKKQRNQSKKATEKEINKETKEEKKTEETKEAKKQRNKETEKQRSTETKSH